jgi:hypothetical protein
MGQKFTITESEKNKIRGLYEQASTQMPLQTGTTTNDPTLFGVSINDWKNLTQLKTDLKSLMGKTVQFYFDQQQTKSVGVGTIKMVVPKGKTTVSFYIEWGDLDFSLGPKSGYSLQTYTCGKEGFFSEGNKKQLFCGALDNFMKQHLCSLINQKQQQQPNQVDFK